LLFRAKHLLVADIWPTIFTSCCKLNRKARQERDQRRKGGGSRATDYMRG
jgi:hypothetical protein